jgi:hypothetical protein
VPAWRPPLALPLGIPHPANIRNNRGVADDPIEVLRRWELAGGLWRVIGRSGHDVTIGLFQCDGGEQVDVVRSDEATLWAYAGNRESNFD